jgi:hypothetical protein
MLQRSKQTWSSSLNVTVPISCGVERRCRHEIHPTFVVHPYIRRIVDYNTRILGACRNPSCTAASCLTCGLRFACCRAERKRPRSESQIGSLGGAGDDDVKAGFVIGWILEIWGGNGDGNADAAAVCLNGVPYASQPSRTGRTVLTQASGVSSHEIASTGASPVNADADVLFDYWNGHESNTILL